MVPPLSIEEKTDESDPEDADLRAYPTSFVLEDGESYAATYVNAQDDSGKTPLCHALINNNFGVAEVRDVMPKVQLSNAHGYIFPERTRGCAVEDLRETMHSARSLAFYLSTY